MLRPKATARRTIVPYAKRLIPAGGSMLGKLEVQPPDLAPSCTNHRVQVTGWIPRGDTMVRLGGTPVDIDLRDRTAVSIRQWVTACDDRRAHAGK